MTDSEGLEEVEISGGEDVNESLLESGSEALKNSQSVGPTRHTKMSRLVALGKVFFLLVLQVFAKFWKVCIAELLLIVLVFWVYGGIIAFCLMIVALVSKSACM